jgi:UDP-glucuronate decarboxylase
MMNQDDFKDPVNLGNPDEYTILEFAKRIKEFTGAKSKIVLKPLPQDDPERRRPDITLAQEKLGWEPTVALEDGIRKTIEYFEGIIKAQEGKKAKVHFKVL